MHNISHGHIPTSINSVTRARERVPQPLHDSNLRVCDIDSSAFYLLSTSTFLTCTKLWYVCDIDSSDFYLLSPLTFLICTKLWYAFILGLRLFPNAYKRYEPRLYIDLFTISMSLRKFVKSRLDKKQIAMHILRKP